MYQHPPPQTHVLCLDEMGPLRVATYAGASWSPVGQPARIAPDYGGHDDPVWVLGALEPRTGSVITQLHSQRTRHEFIALLDQVVQTWSQGELILILDNLAVHKTLDVRLWALAHPRVRFLFQPTYAPWLNLIEPWWKTLRALALKGRAFTQSEQLITALTQATAYWNDHCHPYVWHQAA